MYCHNCGNVDRFVLSVKLSAVVRAGREAADPDWSANLSCHRCASTHVAGDPAVLLDRL
jgi:hypothetical protein